MNALYDFIVKPVGKKYSNTVQVGDKKLVVNTKIENWKFVNRLAEVIQVPLAFNTGIKKGDKVIIHQNVFRTFYDMKGKKKKSRSFLNEDHHLCSFDQIYLYKNKSGWHTVGERCFVQPIKDKQDLTLNKERSLVGILKYSNSSLKALKINPGDLVGFTPNSEWEFLVDNERLYCMKSNDIVIKYEYQGDEEKYNPSWTQSS
jgi:co-chaperonin GroES (HSP10)